MVSEYNSRIRKNVKLQTMNACNSMYFCRGRKIRPRRKNPKAKSSHVLNFVKNLGVPMDMVDNVTIRLLIKYDSWIYIKYVS